MVAVTEGVAPGAPPKPQAQELHLQNQLATSSSSYLQSHKDNPVAWQEWNPHSLKLASEYNRLIFLSIGYSACHWCHVMDQESFSSSEAASLLNSHFIPIKVDREARPDIDEVYMNYVSATTGAGGWPLNVFLTPQLQPVFGGTYWPSPASNALSGRRVSTSDETALSFIDILEKMHDVWSTQRDRCVQSAEDITRQLKDFAAEGTHSQSQVAIKGAPNEEPETIELDLLDDALDYFVSRYDHVHGGFLNSPAPPPPATQSKLGPKFPTPPNLAFLLRVGASITSTSTRFGFPSPVPPILGKASCANAATMAMHTLLTISRSGLRDHLGHGFHRYSVTDDWNLPHFEKMLYDNAQLLGVYCDAWALSHDPEILGVIYSLVEYFTGQDSRIIGPDGGFYASEDSDSHPTKESDSEPREGAFYVWTLAELESVMGNEQSAAILARHFGVTRDGNVPVKHDVHDEFLTQNVLHVAATPSVLAKEFGLPEEQIVKIIKAGRAALSEHREAKRQPPAIDRKIIAGWNGLAIAGLCRAANTLAEIDAERSSRCRNAAEKAAAFIKSRLYNERNGELRRFYFPHSPSASSPTVQADGVADQANAGFLDDYTYLTSSLMFLYDLTFNAAYLSWAVKLQAYIDAHFTSASGGYFQSCKAEPTTSNTSSITLIMRLKPGTDTALPSPNATAATNLLYLAAHSPGTAGAIQAAHTARRVMDAFAVELIQHPWLFAGMLGAVVLADVGVKSLIVAAETDDAEIRRLGGWGRVVRRSLDVDGKAVKVGEVLVCEKNGRCRPLRQGELEESEDGWVYRDDDERTLTEKDAQVAGEVTTAATATTGSEVAAVSAHPPPAAEGETKGSAVVEIEGPAPQQEHMEQAAKKDSEQQSQERKTEAEGQL